MAGGQERILKRRIASVQSTKKITRAMELIAASRIVKAQGAVQAAIPYSEQITKVVADLAASGGASESPLLNPRDEVRTSAHIVITADRGLCGAYNSSVIRAAEGSMREDAEAGSDHALVVVGRKAEGYFRFREMPVSATHAGFSGEPRYEDARAVAKSVIDRFEAGENPVPVPLLNRALVGLENVAQVVERADVIERMNVAADQGGHGAHGRPLFNPLRPGEAGSA